MHTSDITRNRGPFERLKDPVIRSAFYENLNHIMSELDYQVITCVIEKKRLLAQYGVTARDPYHYCLEVLIERFVMEMDSRRQVGRIVAEARRSQLDDALRSHWVDIRQNGTSDLEADRIGRRIQSLGIRPKHDIAAGLELADLVVTPIGRHILGKRDREDWEIVSRKMLGNTVDRGLIVLPRR